LNYIAEIRAFYDWVQFNLTPADAQALWQALMYLNNKCAIQINGQWFWRVEFTVANTTLQSMLKFSRTQLDRMRNVLIQSRRIEYRKGRGNQSGTYRMIPFDTQYVAQTVTHSVTQTDTQTDTQVWRNLRPLNNNTSTSTGNSNFSFVVEDGSAGETREAEKIVGDYLVNRDLVLDQYFGATESTKAEVESITAQVFKRLALRSPTEQDVYHVFEYVHVSEQLQDESWRISFPKDRIELLLYAFEQATKAGCPGNWNYIGGCMAKMAQRGIRTLAAAENFDFSRDYGGM
jgi:hypothetical protein